MLIIAFVLAEPIEYTLSQSLLYAHGSPFHYLFVGRPIASFFLVAGLIWITWMTVRTIIRRRRSKGASA